ncbi:MAG: DUF3566 domain-containing protein [Actinomycetota bacterium]
MSDLPELDDDAFRLATGEELVLPGDAPEAAMPAGAPAASSGPALAPVGPRPVARPSLRDRRTAGRLRARKVRRLVRHVEPWSVLKVALIFYFCLWVILLIAGVMLWSLAVSSGTVDNIETFITELFALESFTFNADQIFRASAIGGLVLVVAGAGFTVLMAVLFNLISDITGGVRFTVVEEETARPRPKRLRPRRGMRPTGQQPAVAPGPGPVTGPPPLPEAPIGEAGTETNVVGEDIPILATAESAAHAAEPRLSELIESDEAPIGEVANGDDDR